MRVLLIEDEPTTAKSIELMLGTEGFNVYTTDLGEEGLDLGKLYDYDIILLDLNLPDMHGYDVLKKLRTAKVSTPVLILSGIGEMDSKVRALGFGADDYVTKPFHRDELVARIHAIVRRSKGHSQSVIRTGKLAVNLDAKTVEVDGSRVHLTGKEYAMLELLSLRKGTTLTKEMFLNHLYGGMDEPELKIIDVFICKLRKKLSLACGGANYIETVWGRGYVLRDADEGEDDVSEPRLRSPNEYFALQQGQRGEGGAERLRLFHISDEHIRIGSEIYLLLEKRALSSSRFPSALVSSTPTIEKQHEHVSPPDAALHERRPGDRVRARRDRGALLVAPSASADRLPARFREPGGDGTRHNRQPQHRPQPAHVYRRLRAGPPGPLVRIGAGGEPTKRCSSGWNRPSGLPPRSASRSAGGACIFFRWVTSPRIWQSCCSED